MSEILVGIMLILLAAFFQGTYALFLKFARQWKWENFWAVFSVIALAISPIVGGYLLVPNVVEILSISPVNAIFYSFFSGMLWGIGSVLFGLSVVRIGLALTYSLIIGLTAAVGSLIPLVLIHIPTMSVLFPFIIGILLMFLGLTFSARAGMIRENQHGGRKFKVGLVLAVISGLASPALNIGFVYGNPILETAKALGVSKELASMPIWIIVLLGGFIVNFGYSAYLLIKAKTFRFFPVNTRSHLILSVVSGLFFFAGLAIYGIASSFLDALGSSVGWAVLMSLMIVISNFLSIFMGEWKDSKRAFRNQLISISILILGISLMGLSFYF